MKPITKPIPGSDVVAVVVAAIEENGEHRGCILADFRGCPEKLFRGTLKSRADDNKYGVDILDKHVKIEYFAETALGIPVEFEFQTQIYKTVRVGAINWNSDLDAEEIEVYTDDFDKETVHKSAIKKQIESWEVPQEQK